LGVGTTGATVEAKFAPNDLVGLRGSFNFLSINVDEEYDDIDYEGDFDATTFGGFVDVAPFKNGFVLSGGAFVGDKTLDLFNARAGVMFTGSPKVDLISTNGTLSSSDLLRQELEAEIAAIEEDADDYKYYPVITLGVARRF